MMKLNAKQVKVLKWVVKVISVAVILLGLPFYFGYGNPLPFANPDYLLWDNVWLSIFPLMFLGLGLGIWFEKVGGFLVTVPLVIGLVFGVIAEGEMVWHMLVPLILGVGYLVIGHQKK